MAIGSGMGSSFGIAVQTSSYTTRVAPDTFFVANSYSINRTQNRVQGEGINSGSFGPTGATSATFSTTTSKRSTGPKPPSRSMFSRRRWASSSTC